MDCSESSAASSQTAQAACASVKRKKENLKDESEAHDTEFEFPQEMQQMLQTFSRELSRTESLLIVFFSDLKGHFPGDILS